MDKFKKAQQQLHASQGSEYDWNLLQTCISLLEHIGDFRVKLGEFEQRICDAVHEKKKEIDENSGTYIPYICSNYKLANKREINEFQKLYETTQVRPTYEQSGGIFASSFDSIKPICEYIHDTTLASIFTPIENQLKNIQFENDDDLNGADLPDYSFAPQEFITVIGQVIEVNNESINLWLMISNFSIY